MRFPPIGSSVTYRSASGKTYDAIVVGIPTDGQGFYPIVSLEFRDERGNLIRKGRVLPSTYPGTSLQTWAWKETP